MEKQVHVSFYASLFRTECKVLTLEEIIILIRRRRWKNDGNYRRGRTLVTGKLGTPRKRQEPQRSIKNPPEPKSGGFYC